MVPRLMFQEWEGFEQLAGQISSKLTQDSRAWPYWAGWTLSEVRTAAWLATNLNLTLERLIFPTDLDTSSVSKEVISLTRAAEAVTTVRPDLILVKGQR